MCMKNSEDGCILAAQQKELKEKVTNIDTRLTKVETEMKDCRDENRRGFDDLKAQLGHIYAERAEWSKWMRENLPKAAKWIGKWTVILVGVAIGINNLREIVAVFGVK